MRNTFLKNLFRDIKKSFSRFISIIIIIAIGVAFYAGVRVTSPDMKKSADLYFDKNNLMDYKIISTGGITKDDINEISKIKDISKVEGSYSLDAIIEKDDKSLVVNVNSLPNENGINNIKIIRGRKPEKNNEVIVEERFLKENNLNLNDTISLQLGNKEKIEDILKNKEFKIVGTANSPLYISVQRQLSSLGNGTVRGFLYILPDVFKSDYYTEAYVKVNYESSKNSLLYNKDYEENIKNLESNLKNLGDKRNNIRYEEIVSTANKKIQEAEDKLNYSKNQIMANNALGYNKEQLENEFKAKEQEINKGKEKIKAIKKPEWYLLGRNTNVGYETYKQDSERIDKIGAVFPLIFFLVATLVSLTTMTRMVQEKRMEIGTFKALGYSRFAIVSHYLIYSLSASIIGSVIGVAIGFKLFPTLIMKAYSNMYTIPESLTPFNLSLAMKASLISMIVISLATILSALEELKEVPASLMRPKAPKAGKAIFLEKIPFLWKKFSFTSKVTARNIFRYKQRFFMTVIGIASCTALIITGFGIKNGVIGATEKQFNKVYKYDIQSNLSDNIDLKEKNNIKEKIKTNSNIKSVLFTYSKNATVKTKDMTNEDISIIVPESSENINDYINLNMKNKSLKLNDDGVIITEKLSKLMGKHIGDEFEIKVDDKVVKAKISGITEQYIQHYVYISDKYYEKLIGTQLKYNNFYGLLKAEAFNSQQNISKFLTNIKGINSVVFKNSIYADYDKSVDSINSVVLILIVSAGILAFVVIYNLTNININERKRELATIKLLGFYDSELAAYIYRENIILTIIGSLIGILLGILLNSFVITTAEINILMFVRNIDPVYFMYSIVFTMIFSIIVNLVMYKKFDEINMIESLKSAE